MRPARLPSKGTSVQRPKTAIRRKMVNIQMAATKSSVWYPLPQEGVSGRVEGAFLFFGGGLAKVLFSFIYIYSSLLLYDEVYQHCSQEETVDCKGK